MYKAIGLYEKNNIIYRCFYLQYIEQNISYVQYVTIATHQPH
jgi:hypothetical protein